MAKIEYESDVGAITETVGENGVVKIRHNQKQRVWEVLYGNTDGDETKIEDVLKIPEHRVYEVFGEYPSEQRVKVSSEII